ncbi:MAG: hypothetical protein HY903_13655 [Deltaproteobacteria bacterium]|nr:hypothetical protein [Deltaproteobacteria bacterium]
MDIARAENNLVFGFADNSLTPTPLVSSGNDVTGAYTADSVFAGFATGDLTPAASGPAAGTGKNVYGDPGYGAVTSDLTSTPRPETGPWDRGAVQAP